VAVLSLKAVPGAPNPTSVCGCCSKEGGFFTASQSISALSL
jgi:hypothetical protein